MAQSYVVDPLVRSRRSGLAFEPKILGPGLSRQLFEAARWSASSFNEQPWRFIVAERSDQIEFDALLGCLVEENQLWAKNASMLCALLHTKTFKRNDKLNRHGAHDGGAALAQLSLQAISLGLMVHPMAGFDGDLVRQKYAVPDSVEVITVFAVGYPGAIEKLDPSLRERDEAPRVRKPQADFVFEGKFGQAYAPGWEKEPEEVLQFWLGALDETGGADKEHSSVWYKKDPEFDQLLRDRFGALHEKIVAGHCEHWRRSARAVLAYIIVLDQFSRNMFRDKPEMFASDALACGAAVDAIDAGLDRSLPRAARNFMYMPLMHSESLDIQNRCVSLFEQHAKETGIDGFVKYAVSHRDIIERFGRFPHRNENLGRESTPEEKAFLTEPGSSF